MIQQRPSELSDNEHRLCATFGCLTAGRARAVASGPMGRTPPRHPAHWFTRKWNPRAVLWFCACLAGFHADVVVAQGSSPMNRSAALSGVLQARPSPAPAAGQQGAGLQWLEIASGRNPALFVPRGRPPQEAIPLVVLLHGAGADAGAILPLMQALAEERRFLLLVPQSVGRTWDVILGGYGPDIEMLDKALHLVFTTYRVDPGRVAIAGFSDGASYALSVGVANGELFTDVLAFSPGFMAPNTVSGQPGIFISHGRQDEVLPIDRCSRRIVPQLSGAGYDVDYREFQGGHVVPPEMVEAALDRFLRRAE